MYIWIIFKSQGLQQIHSMGLQHLRCLQLCFPFNILGRMSINMGLQYIHWEGNGKPLKYSCLLQSMGSQSRMWLNDSHSLTHIHTHTRHTLSTTLVFLHLKCLGEFLLISHFLLLLFKGCVVLHRLESLRSEPSHSSNQWNLRHVSKLGSTTWLPAVWPWAGYKPPHPPHL